jgi:catechol 2,3-dioxygenase-like lactoylglutathione lyase family enzyme
MKQGVDIMMPGTLYETHIYTTNLDASIAFYQKLGLDLAYVIPERKVAFFWFDPNNRKDQMLGIWELPQDKMRKNHFAFKVDYEGIKNSVQWLKARGIESVSAFGHEEKEPVVLTWMPAASLYFHDPDGNELEFIHILEEVKKTDKDVLYLSEWENL